MTNQPLDKKIDNSRSDYWYCNGCIKTNDVKSSLSDFFKELLLELDFLDNPNWREADNRIDKLKLKHFGEKLL